MVLSITIAYCLFLNSAPEDYNKVKSQGGGGLQLFALIMIPPVTVTPTIFIGGNTFN